MTEPEPAHCFHCGAQLGYLSIPFKDVRCRKCRRSYTVFRLKGAPVLTIVMEEPTLVPTE